MKMKLKGGKYHPYKGTYYRPHDSQIMVFCHLMMSLRDINASPFGLPAQAKEDFEQVAKLHGVEVEFEKP